MYHTFYLPESPRNERNVYIIQARISLVHSKFHIPCKTKKILVIPNTVDDIEVIRYT